MNQMRRKLLKGKMIAVLVVLLVLSTTVGIASEMMTDTGGQWLYRLYNGDAVIVRCVEKPSGEVMIPSELDGYPVICIGFAALSFCENVTGVTIPDSVAIIGDEAFCGCTNLTEISIPDSVIDIGINPFAGCNLTSFSGPSNSPVYEVRDGVLYDKQQKMLISYPGAKVGTYVIPDDVLLIGEKAFNMCGGLTGVTIPNGVTGIGMQAFSECDGLTDLSIPDSVTDIGIFAFSRCNGLTEMIIPDSVTKIDNGIFSNCSSLTRVTLPNNVRSIGEYAFYKCENLTSVNIPQSVKSIDESAFTGCWKLTLSVTQGSYAERYAKKNNIRFIYAESDNAGCQDDWHDEDDDAGYEDGDSWWFDDESDDEDWLNAAYPGMFDDGWTPFDGALNQRMATRTGPGTKFTEDHGTLPESTEIVVYAQEDSSGTPWVLVEFVRNGKLVRAYTGLKRVDVDASDLPKTTKNPKAAVVTEDTPAYYGPDAQYYLAIENPVMAGTELLVYGVDRNFALVEYAREDGAWMRAWVPMPLVSFH